MASKAAGCEDDVHVSYFNECAFEIKFTHLFLMIGRDSLLQLCKAPTFLGIKMANFACIHLPTLWPKYLGPIDHSGRCYDHRPLLCLIVYGYDKVFFSRFANVMVVVLVSTLPGSSTSRAR